MCGWGGCDDVDGDRVEPPGTLTRAPGGDLNGTFEEKNSVVVRLRRLDSNGSRLVRKVARPNQWTRLVLASIISKH